MAISYTTRKAYSMLNQLLLGIEHEKAFKNSAAYIQSWLKALKNDNRMIVWAAKKAEEAARYILGESLPEG